MLVLVAAAPAHHDVIAGYNFTTGAEAYADFDVNLAIMVRLHRPLSPCACENESAPHTTTSPSQDTESKAAPAGNFPAVLAAYQSTVFNGETLPGGESIASLQVAANMALGGATAAYWKDNAYGDTFVRMAIGGTGNFSAADDWNYLARRELLTKAAAYQVIRGNVISRLRLGVDRCLRGDAAGGVYQWEAAWALFTGSLEGPDGSGSGKSVYALGDKRCSQFGVCVAGPDTNARNNVEVLGAVQAGVAAFSAGDCFGALAQVDVIKAQSLIPILQGLVREAWEVDPAGGAQSADGTIEIAEGWAFSAAALPELALCSDGVAATVLSNTFINADPIVPDGFGAVKAAVESAYACLGITCEEVGGMLDGSYAPIAGMEPCSDGRALDTWQGGAGGDVLAGYTFTTDAQLLSAVDGPLATMAAQAMVAPAGDFGAVLAAYETPFVADVSVASLQVGADELTQPLAAATAGYWGNRAFGDTFVRMAIGGTGNFSAADDWNYLARRELLTKAAAYQVIRGNVISRLRLGVDRCLRGDAAGGVYQWEAAWALFTGSLEGPDGSGSGKSVYALGDKRCSQFGVCVAGPDTNARNNVEVLGAVQAGVAAFSAGDCFGALAQVDVIKAQSLIPILQGLVREAWEVDPAGGAQSADGTIEIAEGWAFSAAALPELALCSDGVAATVLSNTFINADPIVPDGFGAVKAAVESAYACLGITCEEVGGMLDGSYAQIPGMEPCETTWHDPDDHAGDHTHDPHPSDDDHGHPHDDDHHADGHEHDVHTHENGNQRHIEQALENTYIALVAVGWTGFLAMSIMVFMLRSHKLPAPLTECLLGNAQPSAANNGGTVSTTSVEMPPADKFVVSPLRRDAV